MKTKVATMETEMQRLSQNMESITKASTAINDVLHNNRQKLTQLSGVHMLLKKVGDFVHVVWVAYAPASCAR